MFKGVQISYLVFLWSDVSLQWSSIVALSITSKQLHPSIDAARSIDGPNFFSRNAKCHWTRLNLLGHSRFNLKCLGGRVRVWLTFEKKNTVYRRHIQIHFRVWNMLYFASDFTEICSQRSNQHQPDPGLNNDGTEQTRTYAWTNDGIVYLYFHIRHSISMNSFNPLSTEKLLYFDRVLPDRERAAFTNKQSSYRWFETPWRAYDVTVLVTWSSKIYLMSLMNKKLFWKQV